MNTPPHVRLAVIGGGPAGLRAAECAARLGAGVTVFDSKPSVGRKFLVAGKGGLNLTHGEDFESFITRYEGPGQPDGFWRETIGRFTPADARAWASDLGVDTFQARTGRVYPAAMKAAPLLRRWIASLRQLGVRFLTNHRLTGITPGNPLRLDFANGASCAADAVILATGGASWPQTGSDATWTDIFRRLHIECSPLVPANCGWECPWPAETLALGEGKPLKNITASANGRHAAGELMITRHGLEGGVIYQLGHALRGMTHPAITIDLKPTFTVGQLVAKMESVRGGFAEAAAQRWKLPESAIAILSRATWHDALSLAREVKPGAFRANPNLHGDALSLAREVKQCVIPLTRPRPIDEAISSAGGVAWRELDPSLMLRRLPGCFTAGEMIDWEAPTGGYLIQGCLATGTHAGSAAATWLATNRA